MFIGMTRTKLGATSEAISRGWCINYNLPVLMFRKPSSTVWKDCWIRIGWFMPKSQTAPKSQQLNVRKDYVSFRMPVDLGRLCTHGHSGCFDPGALPSQPQHFLHCQGGVDAASLSLGLGVCRSHSPLARTNSMACLTAQGGSSAGEQVGYLGHNHLGHIS